MEQLSIFWMVAIFVFLNIPVLFLYRWEKNQSALRWSLYPLRLLVIYGGAFITGFFLVSIADFTSNTLAHTLYLDHDSSARAAIVIVNLTATALITSLFLVYVRRRKRRSAPTDNEAI